MARAAVSASDRDLKAFTDCMFFINGHCKLSDKCRYRHCQAAVAHTNNCFRWPKQCRNAACPYRHPAKPNPANTNKIATTESVPNKATPEPLLSTPSASLPKEGLISFFWDIENVPIPKSQKPFDIVQRIRNRLVINSGLREYSFSCYCNSTTISQDNQLSLFHANVRIVHVPDRKPGAVDRQIMLELDRFERAHQPPATIVLISGDIDFVGKLSDLRHQAGFHVIVIHNKPAKTELKATVNAHYSWETFTQTTDGANSTEAVTIESEHRKPSASTKINSHHGANHQHKGDSTGKGGSNQTAKVRPAAAKKHIYECPKCSSEFESVQALRQHQDAKDHLFECLVCDETFVTLDGLTQHQNAKNHQEIEYECPQCKRRFAKIESLNQHKQATNHNETEINKNVSDGFLATPVFRPPSTYINQSSNTPIEDATLLVLQKGIDALVQYYPKLFSENK